MRLGWIHHNNGKFLSCNKMLIFGSIVIWFFFVVDQWQLFIVRVCWNSNTLFYPRKLFWILRNKLTSNKTLEAMPFQLRAKKLSKRNVRWLILTLHHLMMSQWPRRETNLQSHIRTPVYIGYSTHNIIHICKLEILHRKHCPWKMNMYPLTKYT